jgi:hypothetical protein
MPQPHNLLTLLAVAALIAAMMVMSALRAFAQDTEDMGNSQELTASGNDIFVQTAQVWCDLLGAAGDYSVAKAKK